LANEAIKPVRMSYTKWLGLFRQPETRLALPVDRRSISSINRPSTTSRKIRRESVHPFINPLSNIKKGDVDPFMSIENETVVMQHIIHLMKGTAKPKCVKRR
jgi:hypothetical protein